MDVRCRILYIKSDGACRCIQLFAHNRRIEDKHALMTAKWLSKHDDKQSKEPKSISTAFAGLSKKQH